MVWYVLHVRYFHHFDLFYIYIGRSGQSFYCPFLDVINVKCSRKYQCHLKKKSLVWNSSHFLLRWWNVAGVVDFIVEGSRASYFRWSKTLFIGFVWNIKETFSRRLDLCEFVKWKKTSLACNNETILLYFVLKLMITGVRRKGGGGGGGRWRGEKWALFEVKHISWFEQKFLVLSITFCNVCFIKIISFVPKKNFRYTGCTIEFVKVIMLYESDIVTKLI